MLQWPASQTEDIFFVPPVMEKRRRLEISGPQPHPNTYTFNTLMATNYSSTTDNQYFGFNKCGSIVRGHKPLLMESEENISINSVRRFNLNPFRWKPKLESKRCQGRELVLLTSFLHVSSLLSTLGWEKEQRGAVERPPLHPGTPLSDSAACSHVLKLAWKQLWLYKSQRGSCSLGGVPPGWRNPLP